MIVVSWSTIASKESLIIDKNPVKNPEDPPK